MANLSGLVCLASLLCVVAAGCSGPRERTEREDAASREERRAGAELAMLDSSPPLSASGDVAEAQRIALTAAQAFATRLKSTLIAAMQSGGTERAIDVCANQAPEIAAKVGQEYQVRIGRMAVHGRERRSTNAASGWQEGPLQRMEVEVNSGARAADQVFTQAANLPQGVEFRFMKGIETEGVCLTCHGSVVDDSVLQAIQAAYPDDRATGFEVGDLRGALWVEVPLR